ncbi:hypothetical protein [Curtobacterium sp. VKM Ac-2852]|uniref:hypothetical protein n=1 Tax=Curtobacterium sp. VKM Ac-2852 TaxID=2739024 RepID=UPI001564F68E|nr:hypothetical protein [Curtobacterium sp. VKM Ac-2852]NQX23463.1 hypothetical protein [Curtobacterium sp. VKM Ac-2852]
MTDGWAVVIGAVVAFAGTVIGPFFLERWKRHGDDVRGRRDELSTLVPEIFDHISRGTEAADENAKILRMHLLLDKKDANIANVVMLAATNPYRQDSLVASAATTAFAMWFRGQRSAVAAVAAFERITGLSLAEIGMKNYSQSASENDSRRAGETGAEPQDAAPQESGAAAGDDH